MAPEGLRSHLSGSVPVSIVVHLVLLLVLVVIPLASNIVAPIPLIITRGYVLAAPLRPPPSPPPPRPPTPSQPQTKPQPGFVPTSAPDSIKPEAPAPQPFTPLGTADGVPGGLGTNMDAVSIDAPPAPPPPTQQPPPSVRAAELPVQPRKLVDVHPVYPEVARAARVEGTVILEAVLDTGGRVTQLRVLHTVPLLDQAALDAVRQWRYSPSIYYGRPVSVLMTITVRFTLQQ